MIVYIMSLTPITMQECVQISHSNIEHSLQDTHVLALQSMVLLYMSKEQKYLTLNITL